MWLVGRVCYSLSNQSDYQSFSLLMIKCKKNKNLVDFLLLKNFVFIWCAIRKVFRNTRNILFILFYVVAVQLCLRIVLVSWSFWSRNCFLRERAVHALWPQQMVWYCATPLSSSHGEILRFTHSRVWREQGMRRRELVTPIMKPSLTRCLKHLVLLTRKSKITPPRSFENS